jgi:hypothetical protein
MDETKRKALALAIDDQMDGGVKRPAILKLNHPTLVAARKEELDAEKALLSQGFRGRHAERGDREARAAALLAKDPLPSFVSIRVAWLRKTLGKGQ